MKKSRLTLLLLIAILVSCMAIASTSISEKRKKARYYYLEGVERQVNGDNAGAYEYYKKAYNTDTSYAEASSAYGSQRMSLKSDSFQTRNALLQSLNLMQTFVDKYPGDFFESQYYAYVASQLDTIDEALRIFEREDSLFPEKTVVLTNIAEGRMAKGDLEGAIGALNKFERIEGKSPDISLRKITYYISRQDTASAIKEADELIAYNPTIASYVILKGNVYEALNMPDSALVCYRHAEEISPEDGIAKIALANYFKEQGDSTAYDNKIYEALLTEDFNMAQKITLLADYLQKLIHDKSATSRGDYLFKVLRDQYPHEPMVLDLAARYSAAKGDLKDAIEEISYAIDLSPDRENYWQQLMTYQLSDDDFKGVMNTFARARSRISPSESLKFIYANAAGELNMLDTALNIYNSLLAQLDPSLTTENQNIAKNLLNRLSYENLVKGSTLYNMVGDAYYRANMHDKAFKAYENSITFFADNEHALNNYAYYLSEADQDLDRALELSKHSIELDPNNPTFLDTYAWILFKKGEYEEAKINQQAAIELSEENKDISAELYSHMGDILYMCGDSAGAVEYWKKAFKLTPNDKILNKKVKTKTYFKE